MTDPAIAERERIERAIEGQTLCSLFQETAERQAGDDALHWLDGDTWRSTTWGDYRDAVRRVAMGLAALGVGRGDTVAIMATNRPEHVIADVGALHAGAVPVSLYNTLAEDQIAYVAGNCGAKVAVLEDAAFFERWSRIRGELPALEHVVVLDGADGLEGVLSWDDLLAKGDAHLAAAGETAFDELWKDVAPTDDVTLIYTSGTTGPPKGVRITHRGVLFVMESVRTALDLATGFRAISYLPLAHVAERSFSLWGGIKYGASTYFCRDLDKVAEVLPVARPYAFLAVPRVWEKMRTGLFAALKQAEGAKAKLGAKAFEVAPQIGALQLTGRKPSLLLGAQHALFERLVYAKVRARLGLDEVHVAITGAAPMPDDLIVFFKGMGIEIVNVYGMTETTAVTHGNRRGEVRLGTVGRALPGVECRIADDGEILVRGPNMTPGYYQREEATAELLDADGWLHTGDLGRIDADGYLTIVGRKKELIITAGGKNISPNNIEALVKSSPVIGTVCAIGDDRRYISALVALDPDGAPAWSQERGIGASSLAALAEHPEVRAEVQRAVDEANAKLSRVEQIKRFEILPTEFSVESGELTPSLKLKRHVVHSKWSDVIDRMYA